MERNNNNLQDVSSVLAEIGIKSKAKIFTNAHTYEIDADHPRDNWLYPAFEGFKKFKYKLNNENKKIYTFVTIGSGQGLDAIGAYHILHPKNIIITDIHPEVVPVARQNFLQNVPLDESSFRSLIGNLCEPLIKENIRADVIYANLPNIPLDGSGSAFGGQLTSTFFDLDWIENCPRNLEQYLLGLQNAFLCSAYNALTVGGSVIVNLGGRIPVEIIKNMFFDSGFEYQELFNMLKIQTQPEWVLGGYARAEEKYGIVFDFYRYDLAIQKLGKQLENKDISSVELKKILKPFRISATEGLKKFVYEKERIGHVVQIIRGVKI